MSPGDASGWCLTPGLTRCLSPFAAAPRAGKGDCAFPSQAWDKNAPSDICSQTVRLYLGTALYVSTDTFGAAKARYHLQMLFGANGHGWAHPPPLLLLVQLYNKLAEGEVSTGGLSGYQPRTGRLCRMEIAAWRGRQETFFPDTCIW